MEARRPVWVERRGYVLLVSPNHSLLCLGADIFQPRFELPEYPEPLCPKAARDSLPRSHERGRCAFLWLVLQGNQG
jgi:hypothetical protein